MSGTAKAWVRIDTRTSDRPRSERRWVVDYQDGLTGRDRTKGGFPTKGAAQAWAFDYMTDRARGVPYVDPTTGNLTWQTAAEEWLKTKATLKLRTRAGYAAMISGKRSKLRARFGAAAVGVIRREDVQAYVAELAASGVAASTVRNHFYVLHQVLAEQVKRRRIPFNPCADVDLPRVLKPSSYEDLRTYLTPEDVEAIIEALPVPYDTFARVAVYTGCRAGEVAGLQLRDIDTDAGTIRIRRAVVSVNGVLSYDDTKTRKHRTIAIDPQLTADLAAYIAQHRKSAVEWFTNHPEHPHPGDALPLFVGVATGRAYGRADAKRLDYSKLLRHGAWYGTHWKVATAKTDRARGIPYVDPTTGDVTWQTAGEEWLKTKATLKVRTHAGYAAMISGKRSKLRVRFGDAAVGRIRREDVQAYVQELTASGTAASTVRNHFYVLHQVLAEQVKRRRIPFNPCADVDLPHVLKPSSYEDLRTYLTPEDVEAIITALPVPYDTLARLAVYTGCRAGELAGLQLRDVDTDAGTIRVRRAVVGVNGILMLDDTKTRKHRTIAIDAQLAIELDNYMTAHKRNAVEWFTEHPEHAHPGEALQLFVGLATGRAYGRADVDRLDYSKLLRHGAWYGTHWKLTTAKAGLPDTVRFHDLRHAHASWLMALLPPKEVQERLGHASITTTMDRYAHVNRSEADDRARTALAALRPTASATGNVIRLRS